MNLPRIVYESNEKEENIFNLLEASMAIVRKAFLEKRRTMKKRFRHGFLPFLHDSTSAIQYFNEKSATYTFSFVGLSEAVAAHTKSNILKEDGLRFGLELVQKMADNIKNFSEESDMRFVLAQHSQDDATTRLAELDVEKYGIANTEISGSRGYPFYTDVPTVPLTTRTPLNKRLEVEGDFQRLLAGGHLGLICLKQGTHTAKALHKLTKRIMDKKVKFFTYASNYTYCKKCHRSFLNILSKCPVCRSDSLEYFGRSSAIIKSLSSWSEAKKRNMNKWIHYSP
jgi:anaerobic ribonucleoside-triphosphate reductase